MTEQLLNEYQSILDNMADRGILIPMYTEGDERPFTYLDQETWGMVLTYAHEYAISPDEAVNQVLRRAIDLLERE